MFYQCLLCTRYRFKPLQAQWLIQSQQKLQAGTTLRTAKYGLNYSIENLPQDPGWSTLCRAEGGEENLGLGERSKFHIHILEPSAYKPWGRRNSPKEKVQVERKRWLVITSWGLQQMKGLSKKEEQTNVRNSSECDWGTSIKWIQNLSEIHWGSNIRLLFRKVSYSETTETKKVQVQPFSLQNINIFRKTTVSTQETLFQVTLYLLSSHETF